MTTHPWWHGLATVADGRDGEDHAAVARNGQVGLLQPVGAHALGIAVIEQGPYELVAVLDLLQQDDAVTIDPARAAVDDQAGSGQPGRAGTAERERAP